MREYYGMRSGQKGVLVRQVAPIAPAAALLREDDVLMSFDGIQIANDGTVPFRCVMFVLDSSCPCCHSRAE